MMLVILLLSFLLQKEEITANVKIKTYSSSDYETSKIGLTEQFNLSKPSGKVRSKRYIGSETIYYKESELAIRERLDQETNLNLTILPKFGGKQADKPYANLIQVLTHTRSNVDGPVDGAYDHTTGDTISVSVDPIVHKFTKGKWTVFGGSRQLRCLPQFVFGTGQKAVFDCFNEGTYYAFFRVEGTYANESDVIDGVAYRKPDETVLFFDTGNFDSFFLLPQIFYLDYEQTLLQDPSGLNNSWFYSDPFKIVRNSYCYRWAYRLMKDNEIGFVHLVPSPVAIGGVYKEFTVKVWISDPSEASYEELHSPSYLHPSPYSKSLTRRFHLGGLVPCLRHAHSAIEVVTDAYYMKQGDIRGIKGRLDSTRLYGPYWGFKIKVYMDRVVSTLSDITFTITPRQHSSLYECFIADIRVTIPSTGHSFVPNTKLSNVAINLKYSWLTAVEKRFLDENVLHYYGHTVVYVGPPYLKDVIPWIPIFSNPCINQELSFSWNGTLGMTWDFCTSQDLNKIVLPSLEKTRLGLNDNLLRLSAVERQIQLDRSNNFSFTKDKSLRIAIFDFAYTPVGLIFLINDSSLFLHSSDLSLRGLGYNTKTQKYKLTSLVKRRWCARSATPKSHNMWVPAFSRITGHIIIIVQVPLEGTSIITQSADLSSCSDIQDPDEGKSVSRVIPEKEIHRDEADDARVDRAVDEKLRTKSAELKLRRRNSGRRTIKRRTLKDVEGQKTFWLSGNVVLPDSDPHYSSHETDAKRVHVATRGMEKYNKNIVFVVESDFAKIKIVFEANGLSFNLDEIIYGPGTSKVVRSAPNDKLFRLHALEFTGVEKLYLAAVGFQSNEFLKTIDTINSTLVILTTFTAQDVPIVISATADDEAELEDVVVRFTGLIIRRIQSSRNQTDDPYAVKVEDYIDAQGRNVTPMPMSRHTAGLSPINTAIPHYILRINDVILFASLDGSFAKPLLFYEHDPTPNQAVRPQPFLPFDYFDIVVTEQGIVSALSRKHYVDATPVTASEAFIGSVLANEPLRYVHPFHVSNNVFQAITEEGEVIYGKIGYNSDTDSFSSPPVTEMLNVPFWSLLKGSFARSAGENVIPLGESVITSESPLPSSFADPICPFASFEVFYVAIPYVEADYRTRITAEVAFYGDVIPLEADVIVEFSEIQGVSVVVSSFLEVQYDQTIIRKTIELETFIPDPILQLMFSHHYSSQTDEIEKEMEELRVFTITIRPSILNLHCDKKNYFRTIQMNVGCVPLTTMRLIGEAVPVTPKAVKPWKSGLESSDLPIHAWYFDSTNSEVTGVAYLIVSKTSVHKSQFKTFDCKHAKYCRIPVPAGRNIEKNVYGLSFRDILIPKFEQFVTQHARRVTGNVVMYDILDSYKDDEFQMEANTTAYNAGCLVDVNEWYSNMAERANFYKKELPVYADIYRYFRDCFSRRPSFRQEDLRRTLPLLPIQELNSVQFFLFNQTNRNALRLKRKRNLIYVIRAVTVNTDYNRYTYCQKLDTFFVLQVINIIQQKKVIESYLPIVYLTIFAFLLLVVLFIYFYFAKNIEWTVDVEPKKIYDQQEEDKLVEELRKRYDHPRSPYGRLAKHIAEFEKIQRSAKEYHVSRIQERENLLRSSTRAKSESAKDRLSATSLTIQLKNTEAKEKLEVSEGRRSTTVVTNDTDPTASDFGPKPPERDRKKNE